VIKELNGNLPAVISVETTRRFSIMVSLDGIKKSPPGEMQQTSCSQEISLIDELLQLSESAKDNIRSRIAWPTVLSA